MKPKWNKIDQWRMSSNLFTIEVEHRKVEQPIVRDDGGNRWNVYAYIYPKHPMFSEFDSSSIRQEACRKLPLHCGCSFFKKHRTEDGTVCSVQVGSDYNHLGDDEFTFCETEDDAARVFHDAENLFEFLKEYSLQTS